MPSKESEKASNAGERVEALLQTSRENALLRWDTLLEIQVETFLPFELQYMFACKPWMDARTVLDAGCGNGFFLSSLRRFFPDKKYMGLDLSPELISVARSNHEGPNIAFEAGDFYEYIPKLPVDFLIMRLIVQHLRGMTNILNQASRMVREGGSLLIVEPDPASFGNFPPTPRFMEVLTAVERHGEEFNKNRANIEAIGTTAKESAGWALVNDQCIIVSQTGPFANSLLLEMYLLWIDSLEAAGEVDGPFADARNEIEEWARLDVAYSQIGIRSFFLERLSSTPYTDR